MTEPVYDDKFIVFKRESFHHLLDEISSSGMPWEQVKKRVEMAALPDAVVIRLQDAFAGPALAAYASAIGVATQVIESSIGKDPEQIKLALTGMRTASDYLSERSVEALDYEGKTPD